MKTGTSLQEAKSYSIAKDKKNTIHFSVCMRDTQGSVWEGFVGPERDQKLSRKKQIKAQDLHQVYKRFWISDATTSKKTTIQNPLTQYVLKTHKLR